MDTVWPTHESMPQFGVQSTTGQSSVYDGVPTRGVGWVLRWAAAGGVLLFSCAVLAEYAYCLAAELTLVRAARAGVLEATLPRATRQSVIDTIARRLRRFPHAKGQWQLAVLRNDVPVQGRIVAHPGDRLLISVMLPSRSVLPGWLRSLKFWGGDEAITVQAVRSIPSRHLKPSDRRSA